MNRRGILAVLLLSLVWASAAQAQDPERQILARVRLSTERGAAAGCTPRGRVSDDSLKDLRRKIVQAGGNTAIISFSGQDLEKVYADVFRCPVATAPPPSRASAPAAPPPPPGQPPSAAPAPGVPAPPAGPPPPPPPR